MLTTDWSANPLTDFYRRETLVVNRLRKMIATLTKQKKIFSEQYLTISSHIIIDWKLKKWTSHPIKDSQAEMMNISI